MAGTDVAARARGERNPCVLAERGTQLAAERARQVSGDVEIAGAEHRRVAREAAEDGDRRRRLSRVCLDQAQQIEREVLTCLGVIAVGGHPMDLATGPARSDWPKRSHRAQCRMCGTGDDRLSDGGGRRVLAQWSADVWPGVGVSGGQPDRCTGALCLDALADRLDQLLVDGEQIADDDDERLGRRAEGQSVYFKWVVDGVGWRRASSVASHPTRDFGRDIRGSPAGQADSIECHRHAATVRSSSGGRQRQSAVRWASSDWSIRVPTARRWPGRSPRRQP